MKEKRNFLIGIFLSGIVGWTLGFLRLPYLDKNFSFLLGFIACLAIVFLVFIFLSIWEKNTSLDQLFTNDSNFQNAHKGTNTFSYVWFLVTGIIVFGGLLSSFLIYQQNKFSKNQIQNQNQRIAQQSAVIASTKKSNSIVVINNLLDRIDDELENNPRRTLSETTIDRIAMLAFSFDPYHYVEGDSLSEKKWSPERGQLLLGLSKMNIDSISFQKIKSKTSFEGADLKNSNLSGANLNGVNLSNSNLTDANLKGVNLNNADLSKAVLLRCNLEKSELKNTNFKEADLSWAELNEANLDSINLYAAKLADAKLREVDLRNANLEWADLQRSIFTKSNLTKANLTGANLSKANFTEANLSKAILKLATLDGLNLTKSILVEVEILNAGVKDENWLKKLSTWQVAGAKEIQETYKLVIDFTNQYYVIKGKDYKTK